MTSAAQHAQGNLRSIVNMMLAVMFFSLMDAVLKTLSAHYPPLQMACLRGLTALPLVLAWIQWRRGWGRLKNLRWSLHILRGLLGITMLSLFTRGVSELPLSATYTIFFIAPLLITALSVPVLKERVPKAHWWAIGVGFIGVLVAIRPSGGDLQAGFATTGGLAVMTAAFCYAVAAVAGRLLSRTDSTESLILTMMLFMSIGGGLLAWSDWKPVSMDHAALLLALAVIVTGGLNLAVGAIGACAAMTLGWLVQSQGLPLAAGTGLLAGLGLVKLALRRSAAA